MTARRVPLVALRVLWTYQVWDLIRAGRPFEAVELLTECRGLGRSVGWRGACQWFEDFLREAGEQTRTDEQAAKHAHWLAVQSLIWFGREA